MPLDLPKGSRSIEEDDGSPSQHIAMTNTLKTGGAHETSLYTY